MKTEPMDSQIDNLRMALAWLNVHRATLIFAALGLQSCPVISIAAGGVTNKLRAMKRFGAEIMGRTRDTHGETVRWQACLFGCHVEWLEPALPGMPKVRLHQPSEPTVLRLLQGGA